MSAPVDLHPYAVRDRVLKARARIRAKPLVRWRCGGQSAGGYVRGCGHTEKCMPIDVPAACTRCRRGGTLFIVKWLSR